MARRKASVPEEGKNEDYDILIGFIHEFEYFEKENRVQMNGHPLVGRCYRLIKDPSGYRIHVGRDTNELGLDGLLLGESLEAKRSDFKFKVEIVTPANYLALPIIEEDAEKILEWVATESKDLWDRVNKERGGEARAVPIGLSALMQLLKDSQSIEPKVVQITHAAKDPRREEIRDSHYEISERVSNALNIIADKDDDMILAIADLLDHVAFTYSDKYGNGGMPNISKFILTDSVELGMGANVFNIFKYIQRYSTTGFTKSGNVEDLYKAIHYTLFEIQRRKLGNG